MRFACRNHYLKRCLAEAKSGDILLCNNMENRIAIKPVQKQVAILINGNVTEKTLEANNKNEQ